MGAGITELMLRNHFNLFFGNPVVE